ncbi:MAG: hypothetical protein LBI10_06205 [Deltaproteobacteria bacterium]|jgi:sensor histidine kinase regulating citrate/malate metabolism|nr:hypothetical protein [Deltaproteobacteria bacterium]
MIKTDLIKDTFLSKKIFLDIGVAALLLGLSLVFAARYNLNALDKGLDDNLYDVAQLLATNNEARQSLQMGRLTPALAKWLSDAQIGVRGFDSLALVDLTLTRLYHSNPSLIGTKIQRTDARQVLDRPFRDQVLGEKGLEIRSFYQVKNALERPIGYVVASVSLAGSAYSKSTSTAVYLTIFGLALLASVVYSYLSHRTFKLALAELDSVKLAKRLFQIQTALDSVEEGLLAIDERGRIIVANLAFSRLLAINSALVEADVDEVLPWLKLKKSLELSEERDVVLVRGALKAVCDKLTVKSYGRSVGALAVVRAKKAAPNNPPLTNYNHLVEALRSNALEFQKQLRIIAEFLKSDSCVSAVQNLAGPSGLSSENLICIAQNVKNQALGAFLVSEIKRCAEAGVKLNFETASFVPSRSRFLSTKNLIAVVGDLVEHAFQALLDTRMVKSVAPAGSLSEAIFLRVLEDHQGLIITLERKGPPSLVEEAFKPSLGPPLRAKKTDLGLDLTRALVQAGGGRLTVDLAKRPGAFLELTFREPRRVKVALA